MTRLNTLRLAPFALGCAVATVAACGGSSSTSGLTTAGGSGAEAGSSGAGGAHGSMAGQGGGTAGAPMGGAGGTPAPCDPPSDASMSALCISYQPDDVQFEFDPGFDGVGQFVVQVFDYPKPPDNATDYIAQQIVPDPSAGGVGAVAVTDLPVVRFDDLPAKVYVKSFFVDNPALTGGVWMAGYDLSNGLVDGQPLEEIDLTAGESTSIAQHLWALRLLRVTLGVANTTTPLDDAIGPAAAGLYHTDMPPQGSPAFGYGSIDCADLSGGKTQTIDAIFVGSGDFWISAALNDYNNADVWGPGSIVSLAIDRLPAANQIHVTNEYRLQHTVLLNSVLPLNGTTPAPYTCTP